MAGTSPTQRTLKYLRGLGYTCAITEHWNQFARIRQDLFGFIDIVALDTNSSVIEGIQTTSTANMSARIHKIMDSQEAREWSECGGRIKVIGWAKRGKRGERKTWKPRTTVLAWIKDSWRSYDLE